MPVRPTPFVAALIAALFAGCGPSTPPGMDGGVIPDDAFASQTFCPDDSTLTYETFGQSFFDSYCIVCHSEANVGSTARNGAPEDVNFDDVELVRPLARRIDFMAAIGPGREARLMPPRPDDPRPSDDERRMLAEWLACGAP